MKIQRYGWIPDHPDHRDFKYSAPHSVLKTLPVGVDLRSQDNPIFDQLALGSCTANAIGGACMFVERKLHPADIILPSRLFIYFNERIIEGTIDSDSGAELRDGMKAINKWGYPDESLWKYDISKFTVRPSKGIYTAARKELISNYVSVPQTAQSIKARLAEGFPVVGGFTVYESFESELVAKTGVVPMPMHSEQAVGGHAIMIIGYDDRKNVWIVRNSWGTAWGMKGYFTIPQPYFVNPDLASDFWTVMVA